MRLSQFIRRHLSTWEEICFNEDARLRNNVILFTFTITVLFLVMSAYTGITVGPASARPTVILGCITAALFLWQFLRRRYSMLIAWLFGVMSLCMAVYFVWTGGLMQTTYLWLYILPIVGTMVVPLPGTIIYNGLLTVILLALMHSPLYNMMQVQYNNYFRVVYPLSVIVLIGCNYVAEFARFKTQKQLLLAATQLRNSAFTDPLTATYNRRALTAQFGGMEEDGHGLSFAIIDLDHFKEVNDQYGHDVGDKALCHVVQLIQGCMPPGALLYRWGGEEFLLVLKSTDTGTLQNVLEKIRQAIAQTPLPLAGGATVSLAVSIGAHSPQQSTPIGTCITTADQHLYAAKANGRNQIAM